MTMAGKKTSQTAAHGALSPNDDTNEDGAPISKADLANNKSKLISELVNEWKKVNKSKLISELVNKRKKVVVLNKDILKRITEHATSVTKYLSVIASPDDTILTKEVQIAQQLASIKTYQVRLSSKEETFKAQKRHCQWNMTQLSLFLKPRWT
jgi:hypothetical protein